MTSDDETYSYHGYEIAFTHAPPFWIAEVYAAVPDLPAIDWRSEPIQAATAQEAHLLAKQRIDDALKKFGK